MFMHVKKNACLFVISLALFVVLLNVVPQVAYCSVGDNAGAAATTSFSPYDRFHLQDVIIKNNTPPKAMYDAYITDEDTPLIVPAPGVLANDVDADNDSLVALLTATSSHGSLILLSDGSFTYTPEPNFYGEDSFEYYPSDGKLDSKPATVLITVNSVIDPPVAIDDAYVTDEDTTLDVDSAHGVLANDIDVEVGQRVYAELVTDPEHGSLVLFNEGEFVYAPDSDWYGIDQFRYQVLDQNAYGNIAIVTITVNPVSDAPVAVNDEFTMDEDTVLEIMASDLLNNDYDADGDTLIISIEGYPSFGTLEISAGQTFAVIPSDLFIYTPNPDWYGVDFFTYRVFDGSEYSALAQVKITVVDVIDDTTPPVTEISFGGIIGDNGWFISEVVVTLTATDDSSVTSTMYSLDLKNWFTYTGPFTIVTDGANTISFYSIDAVGNIELTKSSTIVIDTDTTGPIITIMYFGDATDGSSGHWTVTAVDPESGIDWITVEIDGAIVGNATGDYAVPNLLGIHTIEVNAANADLEAGIEDQESSTLSETVTIVDDDSTGPVLAIVHSGGATVSDPGLWTVTASDLESGIVALIVVIDGAIVGNLTGDYAVPASAGTHNIAVTASNGDIDRGAIDQEVSVASASITISSDSEPGFVTGGGWIVDANGNKGHFAFVVRLESDGDIRGVFMYTFKSDRLHYAIVSTEWLAMRIDGNYAYFEAECSILQYMPHHPRHVTIESGYIVRVEVWDNPGKCAKDIFQIRIYDPSGQTWYEAGFDPLGRVHGAIVIHIDKPHRGHHCQPCRW
ncbi:MAG: hypothetical protein C4K48_03635 [Candidatus Thorarchaeota archaeon]|nr:MAG: hypothetical protein C4K48_03635 [Candidatus Thorarchaeota archaeon]